MDEDPILTVDRLGVRFGEDAVLDDVSFQVPAASTLAILGPNGSGKTVLLRALIGALPHSGTIRWRADARLGYVPQKLDLERDIPITGRDFLAARAAVAGGPALDIETAIDAVGLDDATCKRTFRALSGGQFQRLLLACALIGRPNVLLLDEPLAGVDAPGQEQLQERIQALQREGGMTVLMISHDLSVVFQHATNVLCLGRRRAFLGPPRSVLAPQSLAEIYGGVPQFHVHE